MNSMTKTKFKKLSIIVLSLVLALAMAFATACGKTTEEEKKKDDDTETTTTATDYQTLKNGDFEFNTDDKTTYPYSSSINWTRTVGPSSQLKSGIIDTADDAYAKLADSNKPTVDGTVVNPRTPYYFGLVENKYVEDDEDKRVNPNTAGTKILMIANKTTVAGEGTSQEYKSSTFTVPVNKFAVVSLWLNTSNLVSANYGDGEFGAFIKVTNKVGSTSYNNISLTNINTKNEWAKYELRIIGSDITSTSFNISVGLGLGKDPFRSEYVEGFVFVDDCQVTVYDKNEYAEFSTTFSGVDGSANVDKDSVLSLDLAGQVYQDNGDKADFVDDATAQTKYTSYAYELNYRYDIGTPVSLGTNTTFGYNTDMLPTYDFYTGNVLQNNTLSLMGTEFTTALADIDKTDLTAGGNDPDVIGFYFTKPSSASYTTDIINIADSSDEDNCRHIITLFAKVLADNKASQAGKITVIDKSSTATNNETALFASVSTKDVEDGEYGTWVKYTILVYNPTDTDIDYQIKLSFGDDTILKLEDVGDLQTGIALFAGLEVKTTTSDVYTAMATGTYCTKTQLYGKYNSALPSSEEESEHAEHYSVTTDKSGSFEISTRPTTNVANYVTKGEIDSSKVSKGIVNSKYASVYGLSSDAVAVLTDANLKEDSDCNYAQVIMIDNKVATSSAFVTNYATINAGSYLKITLKIRAVGDAVANVYLTSKTIDNDGNTKVLALSNGTTSYDLVAKVDKNSPVKDGWTTVAFYVLAGNENIDYRVEVWNGDRNGNNLSTGTIFFKNVSNDYNLDEATFKADKETVRTEFETSESLKLNTLSHTRADLTTLSTNEKGKDVSTVTKFNPVEIYAGNDIVKFVDYSTLYAETEIDNRTDKNNDNTAEDKEDEEYTFSKSVALQVSSIVIAIVILVAMFGVVIRSLLKKRKAKVEKRNKLYETTDYTNMRESALARAKALKSKSDINLDKDEEGEYDYSAAEQVEENEDFNGEVIDAEELNEVEPTEELTTNEEVATEEVNEDNGEKQE